jgi:hypothetical protein
VRRRHREAQFREDRFASLAAVRIFVDEQHQRGESLLVTSAPAAARAVTAVGTCPFVWHT